jgi:hypothetical protein
MFASSPLSPACIGRPCTCNPERRKAKTDVRRVLLYLERGGMCADDKKEYSTKGFLFSGHEPIYFIENKEKTLRASYDRGTQVVDYMD